MSINGLGLGLGLVPVLVLVLVLVLGCGVDRAPSGGRPDTTVAVPAPDSPPATPAGRPEGEWTVGVRERVGDGRVVVLREVRTAAQEGFDRIVLDFGSDPLPGYRIEYVDTPQHACGSGEEVRLAGDAWLSIKLQVAQAHTDSGEPTVRERSRRPGLPNLQELRLTCDFEGHVEWVAGVGFPGAFRVLELAAPNRLVVDIRRGG